MAKAKPPASPKRKTSLPTTPNPTTDEALLALPATYADAPDIPVAVEQREIASLARLAASQRSALARIGIDAATLSTLSAFATRLAALEKQWQKKRDVVKLTSAQRKLVTEAEKLDSKLLAGGRWACRDDADAQAELSRIAEGSDLADTVQDLRDEVAFWGDHPTELANTKIAPKDLARATELADLLDAAAAKEASDVDAAAALELRNRCFWAADELAKKVREGGRYAFHDQPKIAAKFASRYRQALDRRARKNRKNKPSGGVGAAPS